MREKDDTIINEEVIEEIKEEEECDEFMNYYKDGKTPKILMTTAIDGLTPKKLPNKRLLHFLKDLIAMFPNSHYCKRHKFTIKDLQDFALKNDFTDIMIVGERKNTPYSMLLIHLPDGPVGFFRISNPILSSKILERAKSSDYYPELIMNNFNTRLGLRLCRMFNALVPIKPEFQGRRVVTFHNQRDFIFIRHHRYQFENTKSCALQEIGPQFTLRLEKIQLGLFDGEFGEYEWFHTTKMDTSRRRFFL